MPATAPGRTRPPSSLRRANAVAAGAFLVGGSLFAIGAALSQAHIGGPRLAAVVYMVGGVFFSTGGYASVLLAINAPHRRRDGSWARAAVALVGARTDQLRLPRRRRPLRRHARLRRQPDRLAARRADPDPGGPPGLEPGHHRLPPLPDLRPPGDGRHLPAPGGRAGRGLRGEGLGWWIVFVNQVGSVLFMVAAVASFVRADGDLIAVGIANWGTLTGALCFAVAGSPIQFREARRAGP